MALVKQPSETLVFTINCSRALSSTSETITAVLSSSVSPTGLTISSTAISGQNLQPTITGGTNGTVYKLTFNISTSIQPSQELEEYVAVVDK